MSPSDRDRICNTVKAMGADRVLVGHEDNTVFVGFYKHGGCGKMHKNICQFLKEKLPENRIVVAQMTAAGRFCQDAHVREVGSDHFRRNSIKVTPERLGLIA